MAGNKVENYTEIELVDFGRKVKIFSDEIEKLELWVNQTESFESFRVLNMEVSAEKVSFLLDSNSDISDLEIGKINVQGMDYYFKCKIEQGEGQDEFVLVVNRSVFKDDRRYTDRLLTYPQYRSYLYLNFEGGHEVESNIIQFGAGKGNKRRNFRELSQAFFKDVHQAFDSSLIKRNKLKAFRVLDLSKNGVAILSSEYEKEFFQGKKSFAGLLQIGSDFPELEKLTFLYSIDYIDNRFPQLPIFKIGLIFDENEKITKFLETSIDEKLNRVNRESLSELFS